MQADSDVLADISAALRRLGALLCVGIVCSTAVASPVILATDDGPPHMIAESNSGIDIDITAGVLERLGHTIDYAYMPLANAKKAVKQGQAGVTVPTFFQSDEDGWFVSDPVIEYRPTVFSLSNLTQQFETLADIKNFRVTTFQGATGYFGEDFVEMTKHNEYREAYDMSRLPEILASKRTDIVVLDYYIFYYYAKQNIEDYRPDMFTAHALIPPVKASAAFHDAALRDAFNDELAQFIDAGQVEQIVTQYIGRPQ